MTTNSCANKATFDAVQTEMARRRELGIFGNWRKSTAFTSKIKCGVCGANFYRKSRKCAGGGSRKYWRCATMDKKGGEKCRLKDIPEDKLKLAAAEVLGLDEFDDAAFAAEVSLITVPENFTLVFHLADGSETAKMWASTTKKDWWTPEARETAAKRMRGGQDRWTPEARKKMSDKLIARHLSGRG